MSSNPAVPPPKVLSQLLQNQRLAQAMAGATELAVAPDVNGDLQLFAIGASGHIYWLFQDPASDTDWTMTDLLFPTAASFIGAVANPDQSVTVIASSGNGVYLMNLTAASATSLPGWTSVPSLNVAGIRTGHQPDGTAVICVYSGTDSHFYMLNQSSGTYSWSTALPSGIQNQGVIGWKFSLVYNTDDWSGPYSGVVWTGPFLKHSNQGVVSANWTTPSQLQGELKGKYSILSPVVNTQGVYDLFALNTGDNGVYYLATPVGSHNSDYRATKVSEKISCTTVAAGRSTPLPGTTAPAFLTEVFALDSNGFLYQTRQLSDGSSGWDDFICLNEQLAFNQIVAGINGEGNSEVFAVTNDGLLYHIMQDPASSDWSFDEVEYDIDGVLQDVPTYQTVIQLFDSAGLPASFVNATLTPHNSDDVLLEVNGEQVHLGRNNGWSGTSNMVGCIVVNCATDGLGTPALDLWFDGMNSGDVYTIDASGAVLETLNNVTGADLVNQGVLPSQYQSDADNVAQAVAAAVASFQPSSTQQVNLHPQSDPRVVRFVAQGVDHSAAAPDTGTIASYWSFDMKTGRPRFQLLDAGGAAALIAEANALPDVGSVLKTLADTWGDVASAIKHGAAQFVECVVSAVVGGVKTAITLIVQGVKYVFNYTITLAEEALDLVGEIFSAVAVAFDQLFAWLGYTFNWDNILRSQTAVIHIVNELFAFLTGAAETIKTNVDNNLVSFANNQIPQVFNTIQSKIDPNLTIGQMQATNVQPLQGFDSPAAQLIGTHLIQNLPNASATSTGLSAGLAGDTSALQDILDNVKSFGETYGVNQKVQDALAKFQAAMSSPDQYLQIVLSGIVDLVEAAVLAMVAGVQILVDAVLNAIVLLLSTLQSALNAEWNIPIVSDLYQRMTTSDTNPNGLPLTALGLMGLLIAMPATVVYTAVNKQAPFPDDDSLTQFTSGFNSTTLLQNSGLGSSSTTSLAAQPKPAKALTDTASNPWPMIFGFLNAGSLVMTAIIEPVVDVQIPKNVNTSQWASWTTKYKQLAPGPAGILSLSVLSLEIAQTGLTIPWLSGSTSWSPTTSDFWGSIGWIKTAVKTLIDGCTFCVSESLPRQLGDFGSYFEGCMGLLELGLVMPYWIIGGAAENAPPSFQVSAAGDLVGSIGDVLRFGRATPVMEGTEGISLVVLVVSDVAGNLLEAGCDVAAAIAGAEGH